MFAIIAPNNNFHRQRSLTQCSWYGSREMERRSGIHTFECYRVPQTRGPGEVGVIVSRFVKNAHTDNNGKHRLLVNQTFTNETNIHEQLAGAGFVGPDASVYNSTSVTHQIHCVYIMGKIFSAVMTGSPNMPEPNDYEAHFLHCVDYMRQAAMCAGDLAIEPRGENGQPGMVNLENAFNGLHGEQTQNLGATSLRRWC